jgi:hypothetical protein
VKVARHPKLATGWTRRTWAAQGFFETVSEASFSAHDEEFIAGVRIILVVQRQEVGDLPVLTQITRPPRWSEIQAEARERADVLPLTQVLRVDAVEKACGGNIPDSS